ncbi:hypothetical protein [Thermococcus stetteri]|uniref:hypothetical protein n=1 Tax=Thermococcus stetteri TaxID=49900 RepID=UPI001FD81152|nr:hypothetical protein [Thermococcus stetteri]MBP1912750.1 tetratricopeptide (TPR) repeat protein [Thermococcus stetteri]
MAGSELEGDFALKAAINLALDHPDILRDILFTLIKFELLQKAAYAMKLVKEPEKLDVVLSHLAEVFYERGDIERALAVISHITSNFHRAVTLMHLAQLEENRDRERALQLIESAIKIAEKIEDPDARFELMLKLHDLKHEIMGEPLSVGDLLSAETPVAKRGAEDQGGEKV